MEFAEGVLKEYKLMDRIVSVRIPVDDLERLRLIAEVNSKPVGEIIRIAVGKEIEQQMQAPEFRKKAHKLLKKNNELLGKLLTK